MRYFWPVLLTVLLAFSTTFSLKAQEPQTLAEYEQSLKQLLNKVATETDAEKRSTYNQKLIPTLVKALKLDDSFEYSFDKLRQMSVLTAPDNSFRIFTWILKQDNKKVETADTLFKEEIFETQTYRYYGTIQMNTNTVGTMVLHPLIDNTDTLEQIDKMQLASNQWYGAVYYNMIQKEHNGKQYYMLFGWRNSTPISDKKLIEVIHFEDGKPIFGAPIFNTVIDEKKEVKHRFMLEFNNRSSISVNYDEAQDLILYDHLEPPDEKSKEMYHAYMPDGTYEGFSFQNGTWQHVPKVFKLSNEDILQDNPAMSRERPKGEIKLYDPKRKKTKTKKE